MPRPSADVLQILISDLNGNVKKADGTPVEVRAGWITSDAEVPIVTVSKIGEWCKVIDVNGMAKTVYADFAVNLWAITYQDIYAMVESCEQTLRNVRKAHQDVGVVYMVDVDSKRIYEKDISPVLQREQIIVRAYWYE